MALILVNFTGGDWKRPQDRNVTGYPAPSWHVCEKVKEQHDFSHKGPSQLPPPFLKLSSAHRPGLFTTTRTTTTTTTTSTITTTTTTAMVSSAIGNASSPNWVSRHGFRMQQRMLMEGCNGVVEAKEFSNSKRRNGEEPEGVVEAVEMEMESGQDNSRVCLDCRTSTTPLWRSGPNGPKTLCNACGIKYRKRKRRAGPNGEVGDEITPIPPKKRSSMTSSCYSKALTEELKRRQREKQKRTLLLVMERKQQQQQQQQGRKAAMEAGEEVANAALLLMSLSSGFFVHA